jgi:hypothetical protein
LNSIKTQIEEIPNTFDENASSKVEIAFCSFAYSNGKLISNLLKRGKRFQEGNFKGMQKLGEKITE